MASPEVAPPLSAWDVEVETLIIGAGACGLVAALAAQEAGQEVLLVEAEALPAGSTALSAGLIPAAGTAIQRAAGISDSAETFAEDIQKKAADENDPALVRALTEGAARVIDWLADATICPSPWSTTSTIPATAAAGCTACRAARVRPSSMPCAPGSRRRRSR